MKQEEVKIRFNQDAGESPLKWRVLIGGTEHKARNVVINAPAGTTCDIIDGVSKYHITVWPREIVWGQDDVLYLNEHRTQA